MWVDIIKFTHGLDRKKWQRKVEFTTWVPYYLSQAIALLLCLLLLILKPSTQPGIYTIGSLALRPLNYTRSLRGFPVRWRNGTLCLCNLVNQFHIYKICVIYVKFYFIYISIYTYVYLHIFNDTNIFKYIYIFNIPYCSCFSGEPWLIYMGNCFFPYSVLLPDTWVQSSFACSQHLKILSDSASITLSIGVSRESQRVDWG